MELQNLMTQAVLTMHSAEARKERFVRKGRWNRKSNFVNTVVGLMQEKISKYVPLFLAFQILTHRLGPRRQKLDETYAFMV